MAAASLSQLVKHADQLLRLDAFTDYPGAMNGLQVENRGRVRRMAAAVDASLATVRMAIAADANLLIVHHGLFWSPTVPWTGRKYELLRLLLDHDLAVYSAHLPLDAHPKLGNNARLCRALGLARLKPFFETKGQLLGLRGELAHTREQLGRRLEKAVAGPVKLLAGGPARCRQIGVVTGGAGAELKLAADAGVDTFITGEGPHWTFPLAEELGINVFYGGHYATETFGVKALAAHLSERFKLPWTFLDHPSGL
ncbi:MAG TPA: Nif3-like dinuclear metal center hexameric protein [Verrucomicrobiae bacterium]|nr:Nif3-like dinuclear metal center hexameric protein [Verrucomicrobiae bacterium]